MLGKILKYDLRTQVKTFSPIFALSLILSAICGVVFFYVLNGTVNEKYVFLVVPATLFILFALILVSASSSIILFLVGARYFKSVFGDEGYLTMVLPTEPKIIFKAKLVSGLIWGTVSALVLIGSLAIGIFLPMATSIPDLFEGLDQVQITAIGVFKVILTVLNYIAIFYQGIVLVYSAITISCVLIKKHKIVFSIIFYFLLSNIQSVILLPIQFILVMSFATNTFLSAILPQIISIIFTIGTTVALYFYNIYLLEKKYNIE